MRQLTHTSESITILGLRRVLVGLVYDEVFGADLLEYMAERFSSRSLIASDELRITIDVPRTFR